MVTACGRWYHKALSLVPSSGKSYNQLAICELTRGDVLGGAFEYLRALAAADPFSAQDNLISLLDKYVPHHPAARSTSMHLFPLPWSSCPLFPLVLR
jgi:hypothetical protein